MCCAEKLIILLRMARSTVSLSLQQNLGYVFHCDFIPKRKEKYTVVPVKVLKSYGGVFM
jgi:hypothetical protein